MNEEEQRACFNEGVMYAEYREKIKSGVKLVEYLLGTNFHSNSLNDLLKEFETEMVKEIESDYWSLINLSSDYEGNESRKSDLKILREDIDSLRKKVSMRELVQS